MIELDRAHSVPGFSLGKPSPNQSPRGFMEIIVFSPGMKIYGYSEIPKYLYYLVDGTLETKLN
ncbi:hypothetical protein HER11_07005 [Fervidobacterium pennivorans subsp. keratinolyticus]|jgi:CRP-like cAMP-binding protein|nr:hypothetical protein HER11_07005 [Fervidobacterium pennivorans subsp. keratinolyticus]